MAMLCEKANRSEPAQSSAARARAARVISRKRNLLRIRMTLQHHHARQRQYGRASMAAHDGDVYYGFGADESGRLRWGLSGLILHAMLLFKIMPTTPLLSYRHNTLRYL